MKKAGDYIKSSKHLALKADIEFDVLLSPTLLAQHHGQLEVKISRPNRFFVAYADNRESKKFWFDGETVTYLDIRTSHYAKVPGQKSIEDTTFELYRKYGLALPLANLLFSDAYDEINRGLRSISYVGKATLKGVSVDHIAVHGELTGMQIWIEEGNTPLIRKIVIVNHTLPQASRYVATFRKLERPSGFEGSVFAPALPTSAKETKIVAQEEINTNAN